MTTTTTGASGLALAAGGAAVAVNTRASREAAAKVVEEIRAAGGQAEVFIADIADAGAVKAMAEGILRRFGRIAILVLNASVRTERPFLELSYEEWRLPLALPPDGGGFCAPAGLAPLPEPC